MARHLPCVHLQSLRQRLRRGTLALALLLAAPLHAERVFQGGESFPLPAAATSLRAADLDGDGFPDLAMLYPELRSAGTVRNDGRGSFDPTVLYEVGLSPVDLLVADLDVDGALDLVTVNSGSASITVLRNDGRGRFAPGDEVAVASGPRNVRAGDFNGDGFPDLVVASEPARELRVFLGDASGRLGEAARLRAGDNVHSCAAGDFDGDGATDVAALFATGLPPAERGVVRLFPGRGDGTFGEGADVDLGTDPGANPLVAIARDLDGSGADDIVVLNSRGELVVLEGTGPGQLAARSFGGDPVHRTSPFVFLLDGDFDADGLFDLASPAAALDDSGVRIHLGSSDGSFVPLDVIRFGSSLASIAFADLDGDGLLDAVTALEGRGELGVFHAVAPLEFDTLPADTLLLEDGPRDLAWIPGGDGERSALVAATSAALHRFSPGPEGGFTASTLEAPGRSFQAVRAADFDGDGRSEVAAVDFVSSTAVVYDLDGETWTYRGEHLVGTLPSILAADDLDGDGLVDLAVSSRRDPVVTVLLGPGAAGGPVRVDVDAGAPQDALAAADLDGDGALDLVVSTREGLQFFRGDGRGSFAAAGATDRFPRAVSIAPFDLDGDRSAELVVVHEGRAHLLRHPAWTGGDAQDLALGAAVHLAVAGDVDGDGRADLLAAATDHIVVARGIDTFSGTPERYSVNALPRALALGDLDGDGAVDAAAAEFLSRTIKVYYGRPPGEPGALFRRGDADQDGVPTLSDAVRTLERLFAGGAPLPCPAAADADDDGTVAITDAIILLRFLFLGGPPPGAPGPKRCGADPSPDGLGRCRGSCR